MKERFDNHICAIYGIPRSFAGHETKFASNIKANQSSFYHTISHWRTFISKQWTFFYHLIYGQEEVEDDIIEPLRKLNIHLGKKALAQALTMHRLRFELQMESYDDFALLTMKFQENIIDRSEYEMLSRRLAGLSDQKPSSKDDSRSSKGSDLDQSKVSDDDSKVTEDSSSNQKVADSSAEKGPQKKKQKK
jgi:hypothetical protein